MIKIASWNIRGLNSLIKQKEVRDLIYLKHMSLCCIVESKVIHSHLGDVCGKVFGNWSWISNGSLCDQGTRIIIAWDPTVLSVLMIEQHQQYVHCEIRIFGQLDPIFITLVYTGVDRRELWRAFGEFHVFNQRKAWVAMGDFNSMLFPHDGLGGSSRRNSDMEEFYLCLEEAELFDISYQGCQFTWIQKPSGGDGIMRKLDRILGDSAFITRFGDASVFFDPRGISDHSPGILTFKVGRRLRQRGFKFDNFVTSHIDFLASVEVVWKKPQRGSYMKRVLRKLQALKVVCRRLRNSYGCLDKRVGQLKTELDVAQLACDLDPFNDMLKEDIAHLLLAYQKARSDQVEMARQKAKISWLNVNSFFML
ncbi:uncharacterized protein LOC112506068 [Cynara cardunculus var. scolymus]|uniref:uncharacterized protein LOC112506068 n=1 Tax=Cynara cardunculus var. scolymus TaxID=59895 RepID=UPI000D628C6B|nr:uncharacterized protein LOC112506068 [Cynara cardunculus var. scolymus]